MAINSHNHAISFVKKLFGFSISSYIGLFITIIAIVINTRLYPTEELGKINVFITVGSVLVYVSYLGVDQSFCRYFYEEKGSNWVNRLFGVCAYLSMSAFLVMGVIALILYQPISEFICGESSLYTTLLLLILVFAQVVCRYISLIQRMMQKVFSYTLLLVFISVANKLVYSLVAIIKPSYYSAITVMVCSFVVLSIVFYIISVRKKGYKPILPKNETELAKRVLKFGLPLMPTSLFSWANSSLPIIVIQAILGYSQVGIYSSAVMLASAMSLIQSGFNSFWVPYVYENYKDRPGSIRKVQDILTFVLVVLGLLIVEFQDVLYLLVGQEYQTGKALLSFLLIAPICATIAEATGIGINLSEKSYLHIIHYSIGIVANLLLSLVLVNIFGLLGVSIAVAISSIVALAVRSYLGNRYYVSIDSKFRLVSAIAILIVASFANYLCFDSVVRYLIPLVSILVTCIVFRADVIYLLDVSKSIINTR